MSKHQPATGISGTSRSKNSPRRRGRPPGRVPQSARDTAAALNVSHTQVIRHRKIASVSGGASKLLESAGFNAAVDYLAVYRMAQAAWWGDFYARRPGRDEWPTVAELKRAQLAAAREYIAAKHARNLAKAEARNAKRIQRHADLMRQKPGARS